MGAMVHDLVIEDAHEWLRREAESGTPPEKLIAGLTERFQGITAHARKGVESEEEASV